MIEELIQSLSTAPMFKCFACGLTKELREFRVDAHKPRGHSTKCRTCEHGVNEKRYARNLAHRRERIAEGDQKVCSDCGETKFVSQFPEHAGSNGGTANRCTKCTTSRITAWRHRNVEHCRDKARSDARKLRYRADPERQKRHAKKSKLKRFGLTPESFNAMIHSQNGCCAICRRPFLMEKWSPSAPAIDHCHETGVVRGILCTGCNTGLGCFADNIEFLANAVSYLAKSRET